MYDQISYFKKIFKSTACTFKSINLLNSNTTNTLSTAVRYFRIYLITHFMENIINLMMRIASQLNHKSKYYIKFILFILLL